MPKLVALTIAYLSLLFLVAWAATLRARAGRSLVNGFSMSLALGVYATSWTYYGSLGFVAKNGLTFFGVYVGPTLACLLGPVMWEPLLRLCRSERLHSLADVFAFRFRSQAAGALTAGFATVASLPYIAQQIRSFTESAAFVTGEPHAKFAGFTFSLVVAGFAALFCGVSPEPGARGAERAAEQTRGLVVAVSFESVVKLVAMSLAALVSVFVVFDGPAGLFRWLAVRPLVTKAAIANLNAPNWSTLVLLSFSAAFMLPRQFHVAFASAPSDATFRRGLIGFPLYLLALNVGILPIAWAAQVIAPGTPGDFASLAVPRALGFAGLELFIYLGGVSAGSAMVIVTTVALVRMLVVHVLLPTGEKLVTPDLYRRIALLHRVLAATVVLSAYLFFLALETSTPLFDFGMVSLMAFAQFMPGLVAGLFFGGVTRQGFVAGLVTGIAIWGAAALAPLLGWVGALSPTTLLPAPDHESVDPWTIPAFFSLGANILVMAVVSLRTKASTAEREAFVTIRRIMNKEDGAEGFRPSLAPGPLPETLEARLAPLLGRAAAQTEIRRTMEELSLDDAPLGAIEADKLRRRLETNLSDLLGPVLARRIVEGALDRAPAGEQPHLALQLRSIDEALEHLGPSLQGPAAELDVYRRYLRAVLDGLPLGVCAIGRDETVVLWNTPLSLIMRIESSDIVAKPLEDVPSPLREVLVDAVKAASDGVLVTEPRELTLQFSDGTIRNLVVSASALDPDLARAWSGSIVAVVEDVTDRRALEAQLVHRDRLATIGRIAAGVAHEIGNPLTGIALLVQNLRREKPAAELRERLDLVLDETRRIDGIVRGLLSYTRKDEGDGTPDSMANLEPVAVQDIVDEAFRLVRFGNRGDDKVALINNCHPDAVTLGDPKRLTQVFVNLVANAIDATRDKGGEVRVDALIEKGRVVVTVADDGAGIPANALPRVFEPFFSTKGAGQGTGLGLWLVYNIVHEHGGDVTVASEPGKGTVFTLRLVRSAVPENEALSA